MKKIGDKNYNTRSQSRIGNTTDGDGSLPQIITSKSITAE